MPKKYFIVHINNMAMLRTFCLLQRHYNIIYDLFTVGSFVMNGRFAQSISNIPLLDFTIQFVVFQIFRKLLLFLLNIEFWLLSYKVSFVS